MSLPLSEICHLARQAGQLIMEHYQQPIMVEKKSDHSPVTLADKEANDLIVKALRNITPHLTVIAEENPAEENQLTDQHSAFWLVDPLDGTKGFIKRTGEFTVNIGLVIDHNPVFGVIYIPQTGELYYTNPIQKNAWYQNNASSSPVQLITEPAATNPLRVLASYSHSNQETEDFIKKQSIHHRVNASSSLKFCRLAKGEADLYPRFSPTMEWDNAAGDAILRHAGGMTYDARTRQPLQYGTKDHFRHVYFVASNHPNTPICWD